MPMDGFIFDFGNEEEDVTSQDDNGQAKGKNESGGMVHHYSLRELLASLPPRIAYDTIVIPSPGDARGLPVRRRELFDIRAQLMSEDHSAEQAEPVGLSAHDIRPNVYEGGFKTWECSMDLARYIVNNQERLSKQGPEDNHVVVELGAGSAIPSLLIYHLVLTRQLDWRSVHFIFADFNLSVLQLCTLPNVLLNWAGFKGYLKDDQGDLELTEQMLVAFQSDHRDTTLDFLSGPWGPAFSDCIEKVLKAYCNPWLQGRPLVLASESIYSPASTSAFTKVLQNLSRLFQDSNRVTILVAAKRIYFGVGGSIDAFSQILRAKGGDVQLLWEDSKGVGRVIISVVNRPRVGPA